MSLDALWSIYQAHGYTAVYQAEKSAPLDIFYTALLAFAEDRIADALALARTATEHEPNSRVFAQAATYLARVHAQGKTGVYVEGEAFAAFVRGGGNVDLYTTTSQALNAVYGEYATLRLLDVGVGDGLALLPALTESIAKLDLVEPSEAMLARTTRQLDEWKIGYHAYPVAVQRFMETASGEWDIVQATWSLQSVPPEDRPAVLAWMRAHSDRALVAEFDMPVFEADLAPDRVAYIVTHYEDGLAEYAGDGGRVAQGFLMPVMFGYFDRSAARTNWEGPIQTWIDSLQTAGFQSVQRRKLYDYWWADAYLLDAR
jgi:hypothetical protein